jgi:thiol-disulfide isomerase/thioredoxin
MRLFAALIVLAPFAFGANQSLPGCEARPEVRQVLQRELDYFQKLDAMKLADRNAFQERVLNDLIAKYPRESDVHERLIGSVRWQQPERLPEIQDRYRKMATQNPDDPLALYLAAYALFRIDTPETIRLAERARKLAPQFPAPAMLLTQIYVGGKFEDKPKAAALLSQYFDLCPTSTRGGWEQNKVGTPELRGKIAAALRAKLHKETDPVALQDYETLWGLEFRARPPAEHAALRKQVAEDVRRLENLNPKPDEYYFNVLRSGYKQSGAPKETITALEDRILREVPTSDLAWRIEGERWGEANKEPEDQKDVEAWRVYNAKHLAIRDASAQRIPYAARSLLQTRFYTVAQDTQASDKDVLAALDKYVDTREYEPPNAWSYWQPAEALLDRKLEPSRAMAFLRKANALFEEDQARGDKDDTVKDTDRAEREKNAREMRAGLRHSMLKAAMLINKPDEVAAMKGDIDGPVPAEKKDLELYWHDRGRFALLQSRKLDALAYYQTALQTRLEPPRWREGRLTDDLSDEARTLWKDLGGTEVAYQHWSAPPARVTEAAESQWERPKKELPQFELADLSGKTWKLKQLEGRSVLINLWATWCGPCQAELPKLQKFYEKVKDRPDIQVLTFNIDDDAGLVAPFVAEKKYTFPVLLANDLVNKLYDGWAIPQNWLVDPAGKWRWVEMGYNSAEPDRVKSMLQRVEGLKKPDKSD